MSTLPKPHISLDEFKALQAFSIDAQRVKDQSKVPENTRSALDAFNNTLARIGYGTSNLLEGTNYQITRLSYQWYTLVALYRDNWIASKLVDSVAEDLLKNWLNFTTELPPAKLKKIEQVITNTGTQDRVLQAVKWARLFGGAGAVMIIKGQDPSMPLDIDDIPLNSYRGLIVFDRWSGITPSGNSSTNLDRPLDFGLPEHYRVTTEGAKSFDVHSSRVLRFTGRIMPAWEFQADMRWGVSEIERVYTELKKRDNTSYNLASLIFRANIFELRQKGLASMISGISSGGQQAQQTFWNSIEAQTRLMSNQGIVVSDPEGGGLSTHQYGFAGIADVYVQFMLDICGACEIPFSRLFGRGASGLGQTGEGDEHVYYEMIGQRQKREINPQMMKLLPVIAMSTWGKVPADFEWSWNPVNSPTDKEKSDLAKSNTEAVVSAYNSGILWKSTAKKELKQQSSITQLFSNITDEEQEQAEDEDAGGGELELGLGGGLLGEGGGEPKQLTAGDAAPWTCPFCSIKVSGERCPDCGAPNPANVVAKKSERKRHSNGWIDKVLESDFRGGKSAGLERGTNIARSLSLGREFGETNEAFEKRRPEIAEFSRWFKQYQSSSVRDEVAGDADFRSVNKRLREISREIEKLEQHSLEIINQLIGAGRGNERYSETVSKPGPLSQEYKRVTERMYDLRREGEQLYGPDWRKGLEVWKSGKDAAVLQHLQFAGFDIIIENPVGSVRSGKGWSVIMKHPYGYIQRTEGADGDAVDVFLGPDERATSAYVVHTVHPLTREYDEDKLFLGFNGADDAIAAFYANYSDRAFMQGIEAVPVAVLPAKLQQFRGRKLEAYA